MNHDQSVHVSSVPYVYVMCTFVLCVLCVCVCRYVTMMPRLRQALIEFENMEDAINSVQACQVHLSLSLSLSPLCELS